MAQLQILDQANQLVRTKQFSAAIDLLRSTDPAELESALSGRYYLLLAEACLTIGDYSVEPAIDEALELFRFGADTESFAQAKYLKGWFLSLTGRHFDAEEILLESYVHFRRCNQLLNATKALNRLSYGAFQTGNVTRAIENLRSCLSVCKEIGDHVYEAKVAHNLAYLLWSAGSLGEALDFFRSYPVAADFPDRKAVVNYCYNVAIPLALRGDFVEAQRSLAAAQPYLDEFPREHAIYLEDSGWLHFLCGQFDVAIATLQDGLTRSLIIAPQSALVSQIKRLLADCYLGRRQYNLAQESATRALAVAEKIGQKVEIAACWRVFAQVAVYEGQPDEAREWFRKAIDLFNQISSRYELAVTRYLSACSGLFGQTESIALLYLAKEYFESEQVAPYITKVQAALGSFRRPTIALRASASGGSRAVQIVTVNKAMLATLELARNVAPSSMDVLLTGETGTGKDLLARYIHEYSGSTGAFISQNVTTLPATMIEAELFGHKRGSFTGAEQNRDGLIKQAENGTLFLNEIGDASLELQTKLLEVLETRRVRSIGEDKDQPVRFRLIAATNADLREGVRSGKFRPDLYHRLNQVTISLPPLRMRLDDLEPLVRCFLSRLGRHNGDALQVSELVQVLSTYSWPGNVRELEHSVGRLWLLCGGNVSSMAEVWATESAVQEQDQLDEVLADCGGNQRAAARRLGIGESTLRYRLKKRGE